MDEPYRIPAFSYPSAQQPQQTAIDLGVLTDDDVFGDERSSSILKTSGGTNQQQLGFFDSSTTNPADYKDVSGSIQSSTFTSNDGGMFGTRYRRLSNAGAAANFLDNRGFGWLLEVDDDEIEQRPLLEELDIDLKDIYYKVRCVLLPLPYFRLKLTIVRDAPDFWGPLMVTLAYALLSLYGQLSVVSWILTIWFFGSFLVFFLARVLGGEVSYSQVLGIVGYCLIPLVVIGLFLPFVRRWHYVAIICKIFGITWAVYSAGTLLCADELQEKRSLVLYPVFLLYVYFLSLYTGV